MSRECLGVFAHKNIEGRRRILRKMYGPKQMKDFKFRLRLDEIYKDFSKDSI